MILNLESEFTPLGTTNAIQYTKMIFSGGEPHIKILSAVNPNDSVSITARINSFHEMGMLLMAVDALRRMEIKNIRLFIPYFPGARQDRLMVAGEPLSVKVYANIINMLQLSQVIVFEPHSEVTPALIDHVKVITNEKFIQSFINELDENIVLVSPDAGALKRTYKLAEALNKNEVIECSKKRDITTGKIVGFKVYTSDIEGKDCLIVDDICDGGATFIGLANVLRQKNAGKIYLAVSHGIFSKGLNELAATFDKIFTTDSIKKIDHPKLVQYKIKLD